MARNLAQIVFLVYSFIILMITRKHLVATLCAKMGKSAFHKKVRGGANRYLLLSVKKFVSPKLFALNLFNYTGIFILLVLQFLLGWFSFAALFFKILNSLVILGSATEAYLLTLRGNIAQFGKAFFLYRPDNDPRHDRAFASSLVDGLVYALIPVLLVFCNFLAL
ncbi:MAG: hypothetical protein IKD18_07335 [Clostridia bacterium]|nr:hypothetical protein [Clostridia bacterium]